MSHQKTSEVSIFVWIWYRLIHDEGYLTPYEVSPRLQHAMINNRQSSRTTGLSERGQCLVSEHNQKSLDNYLYVGESKLSLSLGPSPYQGCSGTERAG